MFVFNTAPCGGRGQADLDLSLAAVRMMDLKEGGIMAEVLRRSSSEAGAVM